MTKRHTPEQIVEKVREIEAALAAGRSLAEIAKSYGVAETTVHRWREPVRRDDLSRGKAAA